MTNPNFLISYRELRVYQAAVENALQIFELTQQLSTKEPDTSITSPTNPNIQQLTWQATFQADPIPLKHLPKPIVLRTRKILKALAQGTPPSTLKGKRFKFDRTLLRIPISYRYRLICRWQDGSITPLIVLSHEDYNAIAHNKQKAS